MNPVNYNVVFVIADGIVEGIDWLPEVYTDGWYFFDEVYFEHGPFDSYARACSQLDLYVANM